MATITITLCPECSQPLPAGQTAGACRACRAQAALDAAGIVVSDADDYFGVEFAHKDTGARLDAAELDALAPEFRAHVETIEEEHEAYLKREADEDEAAGLPDDPPEPGNTPGDPATMAPTEERDRARETATERPAILPAVDVPAPNEDFRCPCGNTSAAEGFDPCNPVGAYCEPLAESWTDPLYKCDRCGQVYRFASEPPAPEPSPVMHVSPDLAAFVDPAGTLRAAGLVVVQPTREELLDALQAAGDIIRQHNLLSTAPEADRRATLERLFAWVNGPRLALLARAGR